MLIEHVKRPGLTRKTTHESIYRLGGLQVGQTELCHIAKRWSVFGEVALGDPRRDDLLAILVAFHLGHTQGPTLRLKATLQEEMW